MEGVEERKRWRRELGEARREANALREELLHRREEAGRLKVIIYSIGVGGWVGRLAMIDVVPACVRTYHTTTNTTTTKNKHRTSSGR